MKFPEEYRVPFTPGHDYHSKPGWPMGVFMLPFHGNRLFCIATDGSGAGSGPVWEHVSVTVRNGKGKPLGRAPYWSEMCAVKNAFWDEHEVIMQLHPAKADYVNWHPHCLHLWRPVGMLIPSPPHHFVGPKTDKEAIRELLLS